MLVARDQRAALKPLGLSLLAARAIVALQLLLVLSNAAVPARQGSFSHLRALLPRHPATTLSSEGSLEALRFEVPQRARTWPSFTADFHANTTNSGDGTDGHWRLSERCGGGSVSGVSTPFSSQKPVAMASTSFGFQTVRGSDKAFPESFGDTLDPKHAWDDDCKPGEVIMDFQLKHMPEAPNSAIQLLSSQLDANVQGAKETNEEASRASATQLLPDAVQTLAFIFFGMARPANSNLTSEHIKAVLKSSLMLPLPALVQVREAQKEQEGLKEGESMQVAVAYLNLHVQVEEEVSIDCFQAGPMPTDSALHLLLGISRLTSKAFEGGPTALGTPARSLRILFAAMSEHLMRRPNAQVHTSWLGNSNSKAAPAVVKGSSASGVFLAPILAVLAVATYRWSKDLQRKAASGARNSHCAPCCALGCAKNGMYSTKARSQGTIALTASLPFSDSARAEDVGRQLDRSTCGSGRSLELEGRVYGGVHLSSASAKAKEEGMLWAACPPQPDLAFVPLCFAPPEPCPKTRCVRLAQDSDEIMDAEGWNAWKVMHDDVAMMHATPMAGSHVHTPREDRFSEPASVITSGKHLDSGGFASWEIGPADLQLCRGSDGRFVELGCGAFGKVYKALLNDVTEVAVKRLEVSSGTQRALFRREIKIHKQCRSAHVVQFLGACIQTNSMFLVTELMHTSLDRVIHDETRELSWQSGGKRIALDIAHALAYLHKQRIVHLDIKSRNVLLSREGRAKIADVGLSQVLEHTYLSQTDGLGTFAYAAPELLSGGSNCNSKADIWSYGILLHELVTRELPKRGALSDRRRETCPKYVDELILRCLARNPEERPSAKAIIRLLEAKDLDSVDRALPACSSVAHQLTAPFICPYDRPQSVAPSTVLTEPPRPKLRRCLSL